MARKSGTKSAEIERLKTAMQAMNETPETLEEKTGISARTINNYIWGDHPLGGQLLRALAEQFGVSVDWLLGGNGSMFMDQQAGRQPPLLVGFKDVVDLMHFQDRLWLMARCVEESMADAGGRPGEDYTLVDLYTLAMPYALQKLRDEELILQAESRAG